MNFLLPLWVSILFFFAGWCLGWFCRGYYNNSNSKITLELVVQISVVLLWIFGTARAMFLGSDYPPYFINIMFGVVAGSVNTKIGDYLLAIFNNIKRK